jgi:predicted alpha-1,6-mannanase (GH76 family)
MPNRRRSLILWAVLALAASLTATCRRRLTVILAAAQPGGAPPLAAPTVVTYHQRADAALRSFLQKYWNPSQRYLNEAYPSNGHLTGYWTYANGWRAVIANGQRTQRREYFGLIDAFYNGQNARGWDAHFYDDESWMALALMDAEAATHRSRYRERAGALVADIEKGWDNSCCGSAPGGIWWDKAHTQKATASNAGPVIAACELYEATQEPAYLRFARQVYRYWWNSMVNPVTYQVADHVNADGTKVWWKFSYNEGLMIGASDALYHATRDRVYLTNALRVARFMIQNEVESTPWGPVLSDGSGERCRGDCEQFKGPAYHYLCALYRDCPRSEYYAVLKGSADALWGLARNQTLQLFAVDWAGPPSSHATQPQENAAVLALCDFASLQGSYPGPEGSGHPIVRISGPLSPCQASHIYNQTAHRIAP